MSFIRKLFEKKNVLNEKENLIEEAIHNNESITVQEAHESVNTWKRSHLTFHPNAFEHTREEMGRYVEHIYNVKVNDDLIVPDIVLIWWYSVVKDTRVTPGYFEYKYGIDADKKTQYLINTGYLGKADIHTYLKQLKNDDLKQILRDYNLKVGGKKSELQQRIVEEITSADLEKLIVSNSLRPTEKGYEVLKQFKHIVYGHIHFDGTITPLTMFQQYNHMHKMTGTYYLPSDISFSILQDVYSDEIMKHADTREIHYGKLRNIELTKYKQLKREGRYKDALINLLAVIIYDTCKEENPIVIDSLFQDLKANCNLLGLDSSSVSWYVDNAVERVFNSVDIAEEDMHNFYMLVSATLESDIERFNKVKEIVEK